MFGGNNCVKTSWGWYIPIYNELFSPAWNLDLTHSPWKFCPKATFEINHSSSGQIRTQKNRNGPNPCLKLNPYLAFLLMQPRFKSFVNDAKLQFPNVRACAKGKLTLPLTFTFLPRIFHFSCPVFLFCRKFTRLDLCVKLLGSQN